MTIAADGKSLSSLTKPISAVNYLNSKEIGLKVDENVPPSLSSNSPERAVHPIVRNRGNPTLSVLPKQPLGLNVDSLNTA